jgi:hypothetical protein
VETVEKPNDVMEVPEVMEAPVSSKMKNKSKKRYSR